MMQISKILKTGKDKKSKKTVIPLGIVQHFKFEDGDILLWKIDGDKIIIKKIDEITQY